MKYTNFLEAFNSNRKKIVIIFVSILLFSLTLSTTIYLNNQNKISKIIVSEIHNFVLSQDMTQVRNYVLPLIPNVFSKVIIIKKELTIFEASDKVSAFSISINQSISPSKNTLTEDENRYIVQFYFSFNTILLLSLCMTLIAFILTIPFVYIEYKNAELIKEQAFSALSKKIAHDIRSPLSTLNLISSLIENKEAKELQLSVITQINTIAENLLDEFKSIKQLALTELFDQLKKEYELKSRNLLQSVDFSISQDAANHKLLVPKFLYASINNLIQNSIEASPKNSLITIRFRSKNNYIEIQVSDQGSGISEELLKDLGHKDILSKKTNGFSGNGIALHNLSKDLKKISGILNIESQLRKGTRITISLPI